MGPEPGPESPLSQKSHKPRAWSRWGLQSSGRRRGKAGEFEGLLRKIWRWLKKPSSWSVASAVLNRREGVKYVVRQPSKPGKTELIPLPVQQQLSAKVARASLQRAVHQPPVFMVW